jgi:hypothetical protein
MPNSLARNQDCQERQPKVNIRQVCQEYNPAASEPVRFVRTSQPGIVFPDKPDSRVIHSLPSLSLSFISSFCLSRARESGLSGFGR